MDRVVTIELIYTAFPRGKGTNDDRCRICQQLWTKGGRLVAEYDPENPIVIGTFKGIKPEELPLERQQD